MNLIFILELIYNVVLVSGMQQGDSVICVSILFQVLFQKESFPDSSVGKEFTCNAGDPGSFPGSGRSPGEGIGDPFQYSLASLVAQMVKNLPAMQKTWVLSLGWEDPLEEGTATHSSILAQRIPWTEEPDRLQSMGSQKVRHD